MLLIMDKEWKPIGKTVLRKQVKSGQGCTMGSVSKHTTKQNLKYYCRLMHWNGTITFTARNGVDALSLFHEHIKAADSNESYFRLLQSVASAERLRQSWTTTDWQNESV